MNEADLFNITYNYADLINGRYDFYISATVAMIVASFVSGNKLNIYMRSLVILFYSGFCYSTYWSISGFTERVRYAIETMEQITQDQETRLAITQSIIDAPVLSGSILDIGSLFNIMFLAWFGSVVLMAYPRMIALK